MKKHEGHRGFTIVELLIVIVVIAILATISIVAYNGVQQRARLTTLQSHLSQSAKEIEAWKLTNNERYPADLAEAQSVGLLEDTSQADFTIYIANNTTTPANYCASATTTEGEIYSVSSTSLTPLPGECVTNLATNPNVETNAVGIGVANGATCPRQSSAALFGNYGLACTVTSGSDTGARLYADAVTAGTTYTASFTLRATTATAYQYSISVQGVGGTSSRQVRTLSGGQSDRFVLTWTAPQSGTIHFYALRQGSQGTGTATFDVDGAMLTVGTTKYQYADGNSPGWFWNGAPNNSTSTGPAIPQN